MPLITTPGLSTSDSYASLEEANAYLSAIGAGQWEGTDAEKEAALRRATQWIDSKYGPLFLGTKLNGRLQALAWPRSGFTDTAGELVDASSIPREIVWATIEGALREIVSPFSLTPDVSPGGSTSTAQVRKETIGPISVEYAVSSADTNLELGYPIITIVDGILAPLLGSRSEIPAIFVV